MNAKHTPGPWLTSERSVAPLGTKITAIFGDDVNEVEIADTYEIPDGHGTEQANARLIAAAPDLLAACQKTLDDMDKYMKDQRAWEENRAELRAAIARATVQT